MLPFYAVIFLSWASTYLYAPTLATYAASLSISGTVIGLIVGGFGLMQALLRAPLGMLADRLDRRRLFVSIGMLAAFAGSLGLALFPTSAGLVLFRSIAGITPATWPIVTVLFSSRFEKNRAPVIISRCNLINSAGNVSGMLAGGFITACFSQRAAFFFASALGFAGFVLSFRIKESPLKKEPVTFSKLISVLRDKRLLLLAALAFLFQLVFTGTSSSFTPLYAGALGANAGQLGVLAMLSMIGMGLSAVLRNRLYAALHGARNLLISAFTLLTLSTAAIPLCKTIGALLAVQTAQGVGGFMILVVTMSECILPYPDGQRVAAMGTFQSLYSFGMFFGPLLGGALVGTISMPGLFFVFAGFSCMGLLLTLLYYKRLDRGTIS